MARSRKLVKQHLEGVHWSALKNYPKVVNELIRDQAGIYALYKGKRLHYVGLASNLKGRLHAHLRDRHQNDWDRFSVYLTTRDEHMKELESLLLRIMSPKGNIQGGRFMDSQNLNPVMNKRVRQRDAERRDVIFNHPQRPGTRKTRSGKRIAPAPNAPATLVDRRKVLRAWHRGWQYRAVLHKDGCITYNAKKYETPTAAARAVTQTTVNGWRFWHCRDANGDWVHISVLRK